MDWFLYDRDLRHERVDLVYCRGVARTPQTSKTESFATIVAVF